MDEHQDVMQLLQGLQPAGPGEGFTSRALERLESGAPSRSASGMAGPFYAAGFFFFVLFLFVFSTVRVFSESGVSAAWMVEGKHALMLASLSLALAGAAVQKGGRWGRRAAFTVLAGFSAGAVVFVFKFAGMAAGPALWLVLGYGLCALAMVFILLKGMAVHDNTM